MRAGSRVSPHPAPILSSCEKHHCARLPSQLPTPSVYLFHLSLSSSLATECLLGHFLSPILALDAMPAWDSHLPLPRQEPNVKPNCMSPCVPLHPASGLVLVLWAHTLAGLSLPRLGSASWSEARKVRLEPWDERVWFLRGGRDPPGEVPPCPALCHTASPGSHLVYLRIPLRGGGDQAVPSVPRGAPGCAQRGLRWGAWLWPAGYRQGMAKGGGKSEAGPAGPFCPPLASLTRITLPPAGPLSTWPKPDPSPF